MNNILIEKAAERHTKDEGYQRTFKAGVDYAAANPSDIGCVKVEELRPMYNKWLAETHRSGSVLVGKSIIEFFNYLKTETNDQTNDQANS